MSTATIAPPVQDEEHRKRVKVEVGMFVEGAQQDTGDCREGVVVQAGPWGCVIRDDQGVFLSEWKHVSVAAELPGEDESDEPTATIAVDKHSDNDLGEAQRIVGDIELKGTQERINSLGFENGACEILMASIFEWYQRVGPVPLAKCVRILDEAMKRKAMMESAVEQKDSAESPESENDGAESKSDDESVADGDPDSNEHQKLLDGINKLLDGLADHSLEALIPVLEKYSKTPPSGSKLLIDALTRSATSADDSGDDDERVRLVTEAQHFILQTPTDTLRSYIPVLKKHRYEQCSDLESTSDDNGDENRDNDESDPGGEDYPNTRVRDIDDDPCNFTVDIACGMRVNAMEPRERKWYYGYVVRYETRGVLVEPDEGDPFVAAWDKIMIEPTRSHKKYTWVCM